LDIEHFGPNSTQKLTEMVTIIDYKERHREDGSSFYVLEIQGGIELVMSQQTGQYYVTAKRAFIPSTFNEDVCASLVGSTIPGSIAKQECEPYEFVVKETGEMVTSSHRWMYVPEPSELEAKSNANSELISHAESLMNSPVHEELVEA
jgi:hypothetical protein